MPTMGAVEVLCCATRETACGNASTKPGRKTHTGTELSFGDGELTATVVGEVDDGNKLVQFHYKGIFLEVLERLGQMPLPPYIQASSCKTRTLPDRPIQERTALLLRRQPAFILRRSFWKSSKKQGEPCICDAPCGTRHVPPREGRGDPGPSYAQCMMSVKRETLLNWETHQSSATVIVCVGTTSCRTVESLVEPDGTFREKVRVDGDFHLSGLPV